MADRHDEAWTQLGTHIRQSLHRQQDGPDAARASRRADDDDLHPRPESATLSLAVAGGRTRRSGGGRLSEGKRAPVLECYAGSPRWLSPPVRR